VGSAASAGGSRSLAGESGLETRAELLASKAVESAGKLDGPASSIDWDWDWGWGWDLNWAWAEAGIAFVKIGKAASKASCVRMGRFFREVSRKSENAYNYSFEFAPPQTGPCRGIRLGM
jgi:hypothetical protein